MTAPRFVAISTDPNDRLIYAGPNLEMTSPIPENRRWVEEFRAMSAGYAFPDKYTPEAWAASGAVSAESADSPAARTIHGLLQSHLARSSKALRELTELPTGPVVPDMARMLVRHERAMNLILRAMLEVFDSEPPSWVSKEDR